MGAEQQLLKAIAHVLEPHWAICRFCGGVLDPHTDMEDHECKEWARELPQEERNTRYQRAKSYCVE